MCPGVAAFRGVVKASSQCGLTSPAVLDHRCWQPCVCARYTLILVQRHLAFSLSLSRLLSHSCRQLSLEFSLSQGCWQRLDLYTGQSPGCVYWPACGGPPPTCGVVNFFWRLASRPDVSAPSTARCRWGRPGCGLRRQGAPCTVHVALMRGSNVLQISP